MAIGMDDIKALISTLEAEHILKAGELKAQADEVMSARASGDDRDSKREGEGDATAVDASALRALAEKEEDSAQAARNALKRIEKGTYGVCESCKNGITLERLEFMPLATMCVDCQSGRGLRARSSFRVAR